MSLFPSDSLDYTSHQNSHLQSFVNHSLSYSPSSHPAAFLSDESFISNFSGFKKSGPIYSMHRYWTKQPIDIIKHFINYFSPPDGIVLDPFCGTGTTGTASLFAGRKVILSDLSPIATFIAKNYTEFTDVPSVHSAIADLETKLSPVLKKFYTTCCPECDSPASIKDWIYTENYICTECNTVIPFIGQISDWNSIKNHKHAKTVQCSNCSHVFNKNILKTADPSVVGLRYSCSPCKVRKNFKLLDVTDQKLLQDQSIIDHQASLNPIPLPLGISTNQAINKHVLFVNQLFSPVTFFILTQLWSLIIAYPQPVRSKLQFLFTSITYRVTKLYRLRVKGQGGILSGTLYIPPLFQDINVWDVFLERFRKISKGWLTLNESLPPNYHDLRIISTHSATQLPLPDNSIDYIYTDPPYGGNINYSELNFIWESWFNQFTNQKLEVIINELGQHKDLLAYEKLFQAALSEMYRVLKPDHWCSLVFNSSSSKIWSSIQHTIDQSHFLLSEDIISLDSNMTTAKQTQSLKTARRYMVLNLFKQDQLDLHNKFSFVSKKNVSSQDVEKFIINEIIQLFSASSSPELGYDQIYEHIIPLLLTKFNFNEFNLESILERNFNSSGNNHWSIY